jgi:hypothetical protein
MQLREWGMIGSNITKAGVTIKKPFEGLPHAMPSRRWIGTGRAPEKGAPEGSGQESGA